MDQPGDAYRHIDGGLYVIVEACEMKCPFTGEWWPAIAYRSIKPDTPRTLYVTTRTRWAERFRPEPTGEAAHG